MWCYMGISVVLILTATVYWPILQSEYVAYDDGLLIVDNVKARGVTWENVKQAFTTYDPELYIPLTLLTEQIEYTIVGRWNPAMSHGISLILHTLNAVLVWWLMGLFLKAYHARHRVIPSVVEGRSAACDHELVPLIIALLWAVHPLNLTSRSSSVSSQRSRSHPCLSFCSSHHHS
ncbi:hypothetical protein A3H22_01390 [Candidatus Peribacteria bacterium RIFCSPLOWO2_12_FULL_55_15]|nr:MAG: hypothetical protein A3H22_01390 [Candidatus Peribacteria bacterium RIFCSPLOWO2_12_FULL_55_15]